MLRVAKINNILNVMKDKGRVRNIGVLAHIDHGKTTLTDLLLAEAGLIPYDLAGEIRVLDYLEEEQRRGITIKTANISLLHKVHGEDFVVNLVDTPGHVDFTGKVTRALRAIDGAIILVDAVEEIMAQTEVVVRQALRGRVKPILFINKVDRLITELKMSIEEIKSKISHIIHSFNSLIDIYSEPQFRDDWKVGLSKGNIIIGSALHKWGLTIKASRERGIKFSDIIRAYKSGELKALQEEIPLSKAILEAIVEKLPSPLKAQEYRIPKIWSGDPDSEIGRAMVKCDSRGPVTVYVTSVKKELKEGLVATGRIFSGEISVGDRVYLLNASVERDIKEVSIYMGKFRENVPSLKSGNIVALSGLKSITAGETIVDTRFKDRMAPFDRIVQASEPVITVSIEPRDPKDLPHLIDALNLLSIEDPSLLVSINKETGEYLLSGIGELHIDIALKSLRDYEPELDVVISKPTIAYRESVSRVGAPATSLSPNGLNQITIRVSSVNDLNSKSGDERLIYAYGDNNVLVSLVDESLFLEDLDAIIEGFKWACNSGPLCGWPLRNVKAKIIDMHLSSNPEERRYAQITPTVKRAVHESILSADPILLEPIYDIQVTAPTEQIGIIANTLTKRRGKISSLYSRGPITVINGLVPVAESIELAGELRSASSGRAFWQCKFSGWERVPADIMPRIVASLRVRRGLPTEDSDLRF
ncbi:MAG: GTP-binding protein [Candidatus Bathyarchaeia archaeon]